MDDTPGAVRLERPFDHAVTLTIDRPDRANALTAGLASELRARISEADCDPDVHVILLRGAGDRVFCGGYDLGAVSRGVRDDALQALLATVRSTAVPTVAVVNGHAVGAGFDLACSCDLRVVRQGTKVGLPAVRLGVAYDVTGLRRILAVVPATRRLLLTGELVPADELAGFADVTASGADELDTAALALAGDIAAASPAALAYMVAMVRPRPDAGPAAHAAQQWRYEILDGPDADEALAAREDGRPTKFAPRQPHGPECR